LGLRNIAASIDGRRGLDIEVWDFRGLDIVALISNMIVAWAWSKSSCFAIHGEKAFERRATASTNRFLRATSTSCGFCQAEPEGAA